MIRLHSLAFTEEELRNILKKLFIKNLNQFDFDIIFLKRNNEIIVGLVPQEELIFEKIHQIKEVLKNNGIIFNDLKIDDIITLENNKIIEISLKPENYRNLLMNFIVKNVFKNYSSNYSFYSLTHHINNRYLLSVAQK